jgi:hypothetical protein
LEQDAGGLAMSAALSFIDPERSRVVFDVQGDEGRATCECVVSHYGRAVTHVAFPSDWRDLLAQVGIDPFDVDGEALLCRLAEKAFTKLSTGESR